MAWVYIGDFLLSNIDSIELISLLILVNISENSNHRCWWNRGHIVSPGEIDVTGEAQIILGQWSISKDCSAEKKYTVKKFAETFNCAKIPTQVSLNIQQGLWHIDAVLGGEHHIRLY